MLIRIVNRLVGSLVQRRNSIQEKMAHAIEAAVEKRMEILQSIKQGNATEEMPV
jgi:hypothetical protein